MILRAVRHELIPARHERVRERRRVRLDLRLIRLEHRPGGVFQSHRERADLVVVRAALQRRKHRHVDLALVVVRLPLRLASLRGARTAAEEDHPRARTAEGLVRRRRDDVGHRAALVGDIAEALVVPIARVRAPAADEHLRAEVHRLLLELVVVDVPCGVVHLVREGLEEDGRRGDLLPARGVVPVREVAARGEVQTHDPVVRDEERGVHCHVRGGAAVRLDVDPPLGLVEAERGERAVLAEPLHLVDVLVSAVVPRPGEAFAVLVREARPEGFHHGRGREVFGRDELDPSDLTVVPYEAMSGWSSKASVG
eukprot:31525-Pelagococcus_subviridis.AAC.1